MELMNNQKRDLPNATTVLVLGILALIFCLCYGILGLIFGIVTVAIAANQRKLYFEFPDTFTESSFRSLNSGRICGIVAICISSFIVLIWILVMIGIFTIAALDRI